MNHPAVLVRRARRTDTDDLGRIHVAAWRAAYRDQLGDQLLAALDPAQFSAAWDQALTNHAADAVTHAVVVAEQDGAVVGFAALSPSADPDAQEGDGELTALLVDPDHTRAGHGSRLLAAATDIAAEGGVSALYHWGVVGDAAREDFLTSAGFETDGAWRETPLDPQHTLMERRWVALLGA